MGNLKVQFADGWYEEVRCEEFDEILKTANEKLKKATKGVGKGKKGKGKEPNASSE